MSGASERANGRASGPILTSRFLVVPDHSAPLKTAPTTPIPPPTFSARHPTSLTTATRTQARPTMIRTSTSASIAPIPSAPTNHRTSPPSTPPPPLPRIRPITPLRTLVSMHYGKRDAQRQYMVIGTLAPYIVEFLLLCSDWGSGPEGGDVLLN